MEQIEFNFKAKPKPRRKAFTRQNIAKFFEDRYGDKGRGIAKRFRRLKKYKNKGQYRDGVFYCKAGKPITEERCAQYDKMCHKMVRMLLPALALYEKSYNYDDLIVSCQREVFLALLDGFDPKKAMTSTLVDKENRKRAEHKKRLNYDATLENSEKNIVWGRLKNFVRRERHKYSPKEIGGRTESLEVYVDGQLRNNELNRGVYTEINPDIPDEIRGITDHLLEILENKGPEAVLIAYEGLSGVEADLVVRLLTGSENPLSMLMSDEDESKEYNYKEEPKNATS